MSYDEHVMHEHAYVASVSLSLRRSAPEHAKLLQESMSGNIELRHELRRRLAMNDEDLIEHLKTNL